MDDEISRLVNILLIKGIIDSNDYAFFCDQITEEEWMKIMSSERR